MEVDSLASCYLRDWKAAASEISLKWELSEAKKSRGEISGELDYNSIWLLEEPFIILQDGAVTQERESIIFSESHTAALCFPKARHKSSFWIINML